MRAFFSALCYSLIVLLLESVPVCAEISEAGQTVMTCRFENWQMS